MSSLSNNNIREDVIFKGKVKDVLLRNSGSGGLVNVLLDFNARDAAAVQSQNNSNNNGDASGKAALPSSPSLTAAKTCPSLSQATFTTSKSGLTYTQFITFLSDHGVELTLFEQQYLCRAFDDSGSGVISASTFTRHLTGLNERRLRAVKKAWTALEKNKGEDDKEVSREVLLSSYQAIPQQQQKNTLSSTFSDSKRQQLKESYLASTTGRAASGANSGVENNKNDDGVSYAEFVAFYAGVSAQFGTDEDFVAHVLKSWAADDVTRPVLSETDREWGAEGDPLALNRPRYVQNALNYHLGLSSKSYSYSHMQRKHPHVEPLPPLNRLDVMVATTQKTYVRFDEVERTLANPLATRRGQAI